MSVQEETVRRLLAELNEVGEHTRIEAKTASELGKSVLETICAFANEPDLGGGHLLLGVARAESPDLFNVKPYTVLGMDDPERISDDLATQCASAFNRPIRPRVTPVTLDGKTVLHVQIEEARAEDKPVYLTRFGLPRGAFRRISATDQKGTDDDLRTLYASHRQAPYDREPAARATLADIDPDAIRTYRKLLSDVNSNAEALTFSDEELLEALGAAEKVGDELKPTVAGVLLFGTRLALRRDFAMMRVDYMRVPGTEWVEDASNRYDALVEIRAPLLTALLRAETAVLDDLPKKFHLPEGEPSAPGPASAPTQGAPRSHRERPDAPRLPRTWLHSNHSLYEPDRDSQPRLLTQADGPARAARLGGTQSNHRIGFPRHRPC